MTGQLVVADSPTASDTWSGQLLGIAIYDRELTPAKVIQHYEGWTKSQKPQFAENEVPVALYLFNERNGRVVHNQAGSAPDLLIPEHYFVLHPTFFQTPWQEFRFKWYYWKDVTINIAGFIPLGFFFCAYFSSVRKMNKPALATIALGLTVSLTIELLQAFLPTRSSGTTDVITNTLGTALGTMFYGNPAGRMLLAKIKC